MSHYLQDAYQPLHATDNYDGQQTGQRGLHQRFERDLFERFEARLVVNPAPPARIGPPRDVVFDILLSSFQLVAPLLEADKKASTGRRSFDAEYYEAFFLNARPILEKRLAEAIMSTAALIVSAWEQAGQPVLLLQESRPTQR